MKKFMLGLLGNFIGISLIIMQFVVLDLILKIIKGG